jgi:hypothetical protein
LLHATRVVAGRLQTDTGYVSFQTPFCYVYMTAII